RRTPEATAPSVVTFTRPSSPVWSRCVPPHSSVEKSPILMTRTRSPYFSPKRARAPIRSASSRSVSIRATWMLAWTCSFTSPSICATSRSFTWAPWEKSNRRCSGATSAPGDRAGVADLAARLRVRGRAVEDHLDLGALRRLAHASHPAPARIDDRQDPRGRRERVVSDELDARDLGGEALVDRRRLGALVRPERRARPRARAPRLHLSLVGSLGRGSGDPPLVSEDFLGQVPGEPVG